MKKSRKRILSLFLAVLMALTGALPAATAFGADGVEGYYDIELFYADTDTIVPTYIDDTAAEPDPYVEYMIEGQELKLTYKLIDTVMPNNAYVKWYSETPTLVDVTQEGVVKAFDSSKGAVLRTWIDNEVRTIPLVGGKLGDAIEKVIFNDKVNVDTMDTDEIVKLVETVFSIEGANPAFESYKEQLLESLKYYLDNINSNIHVQLFAADGTLLDDDYVRICVQKCEEWYANFLPNGTHITKKSQVPTTVAVGSTVQLYGITTPLRLHYKTMYSVKSSSIFGQGKVVATVTDGGLVTFKNKGTVTIIASPDTEEIIQRILEMVNYFYQLENTGTLNTDEIARILIEYVGLDINRAVLAGILDVCFAIKDIAGDAADPVQLTATAVEVISNLVLQFVYNDSITFTVVDAQPLESFDIEGLNTVKEGAQIQLSITNINPTTGNVSDITWRSSDPSIASVDPVTGVITGRDAGGSFGTASSKQCTIYAVSAANNVERSFNLTVTGRTGKYISDIEITGPEYLEMQQEADYEYSIFPSRVAQADNLYVSWGMITGEDEEGNPVYSWANPDEPVTDGSGEIASNGHYKSLGGGNSTIVLRAQTGYFSSSGKFYEISSMMKEFVVVNGIPVEEIVITPISATSNGKFNRVNTVGDTTYVSIHKGVGEAYLGNGAVINAQVYPANASVQTLTWVLDNTNTYSNDLSDDTKTATIKQKAGKENADMFNVYAVSADGRVVSNTVTVCITRNYALSNTIDQESIEVVRGNSTTATHTVEFEGGWTSDAYACRKCNWFSSDETVFSVIPKNNDNRDATIVANDVGTATLTCVSTDGGIVDTCEVTVYPDKTILQRIVDLCDQTVVKRTSENRTAYTQYMRRLDLAYSVLYNEPLASQLVCDTTAEELLYAFYRLGGFVSIAGVNILDNKDKPLENKHVTVSVGSTSNYKNYSYDFNYQIVPKNSMYSEVIWTSSNPKISVDKDGRCKPTENDPCSAIITCTVKDYLGNATSDHVYISFARNKATGVTLNKDSIVGGEIRETEQLTATVYPDKVVNGASCKSVYWYSDDESVATVDENGVVTFVAGGDCTVYCVTYDGGHTAQCAVNVVTNYSGLQLTIKQCNDLQLNSVNYFPESWEVYMDAMTRAQAMIDKGGYSQKEVDAMDEELQAAFNGLEKYNYIQKVELYLDGEATKDFYQFDLGIIDDMITDNIKNGITDIISYKNAVLDLNVRLYPNNGLYASVEWESSTTDIAVTQDGKCSPTINSSCYGLITCTVTDHFGNQFSDSVWVSFAVTPVTAMQISEDNIAGAIGTTHQLTCTVQPTGTSLLHIASASITDYYWESADESIATVDQNGLVTFVGAGATEVRAISYDGGVTGVCQVSSEGDRTALRAAIELAQSVNYMDYDSAYGIPFKAAYDDAVASMSDNTLTQDEIDLKAATLSTAYNNMISHPFIAVESVGITYTAYANPTFGGTSTLTSGTVTSKDALSIDLSGSKASYNSNNYVVLNPSAAPSNAMFKSISWNVDSTSNMKSSVSNTALTLTPTKNNDGGWAVVTAVVTDNYDRQITRTIIVTMSDKVCKGISVSPTSIILNANQKEYQLSSSVSGSPEFNTVLWFSSDESVVTIDQTGKIAPVDKGTAVITAKTLDGGYTATVNVTINTDFTQLASKYTEYYNFLISVQDAYAYTEESLDVLRQSLIGAQQMINDGAATQSEVNAKIAELDDAYNSLKAYIVANDIKIGFIEADGVSLVNEGFIRYKGTSINNKTVDLTATVLPADSEYTSMVWSSSNPKVTISQNGALTNVGAASVCTLVTCTITNIRGEEHSSSVYVSFVRAGATGISFADEMVYGAPAQTVQLSPIITNDSNTSSTTLSLKDCIYQTSDPSIATVDEKGVVTFVSQGVATITATTCDGGFSATIQAMTTWDTTALKAAIDEGKKINYQDYAYAQGTAFKTAFDNAEAVYANLYASQAEINDACEALLEAISNLEDNEFVHPNVTVSYGEDVIENGGFIEVDGSKQAVLTVDIGERAMVKSCTVTPSDENGCTAVLNDNQLTVTKTGEGTGSFTLTVVTVDDWDREETAVFTFNVVEALVNATSIAMTADGELVTGSIVRSCGGSYNNFKGIQLGYVTTPENANAIQSVKYTSSAPLNVAVDENTGLVKMGPSTLRSSYTVTITCTVTNADGSTASSNVSITITKA